MFQQAHCLAQMYKNPVRCSGKDITPGTFLVKSPARSQIMCASSLFHLNVEDLEVVQHYIL